jgi:signal transduction histidine kinase
MGNPKMIEMILREEASDNKFSGVFSGQAVLFTYQPILDKGWYLVSVAPNSYLYAESATVGWWALLIGICISSLAILISFNFAMGISNPLNRVMSAMKQVESGDLSVRVEVKSQDELGRLGTSFNFMLSRINELTQLAQAYNELKDNQQKMLITEKMASLGRLTAGIAHEMNTPLAAVRAAMKELSLLIDEYRQSINNSQVLPEDHQAIVEEMLKNLRIAEQAAEKSAGFIRGIKGQTVDLTPAPLQTFQIAPVIKDTLSIIEFALRRGQCELITDLNDSLQIHSNQRWLSQIVTNLVLNAIDACKPSGGTIRVTLKPGIENTMKLEIQDSGCGISPENLSYIFDPLFTTKPFGEGTGLGLSIVLDLVNQLKGTIEVASQPGMTLFTVSIPLEKGE